MKHFSVIGLKKCWLLSAFFFLPVILGAAGPRKTRILFLLDASSSMTYTWNPGFTRFDVAGNILLKIMDSIYSLNNEIEFAVRAYGSGYAAQLHNCTDTKLEVPFNLQNTDQIKTRLANIHPVGSSPIAYSLKQASDHELNQVSEYDYSVIFITDGGESCNGDVCGVYQELLQKKISIKPYIIGLDSNETLRSYYQCMGDYIQVNNTDDIDRAIRLIVEANQSIIQKPRQLNLQTRYSNVSSIKDSIPVVPVTEPKKIIEPESIRGSFIAGRLHSDAVFRKAMARKIIRQKAVLHFDYEEPKKNSRDLATLYSYPYHVPVYPMKWKIRTMPANRKQKAVLHFEYEEARKNSPDMQSLASYYPKPLNRKVAAIPIRKSNFRFARKASLQFEYEEPKKSSPPMEGIAPQYRLTVLKRSVPLLSLRKNNIKFPRKASLALEYEEPKKTSPVMAMIRMMESGVKIQKAAARMEVKRKGPALAKKASLILPYEVPPKINMAELSFVKYPRRYSYAFRMPDTHPMDLKGRRATLHFKVEEPKATATAKKDTVLPSSFPNPSVEFTTEVVSSTDTRVQVFFKGTNGKTYPNAKPMIEMQDVRTQQTVRSFKREMKGADPVPQEVPAGKYNLIIKGFDDLYANNIEIAPNTTTKVIIKVSDGTLKFTYQGNIKRPVTEYRAIVNRRFHDGATVIQRCDETKLYEPGTYYVEINTLPVYKASIDLTFDATYEIQISEPGTLAVMNSNNLGKVQIQSMLGDQFVTIYTMNVNGNPENQRVQLLPYSYKLIYPVDPKMPQLGNKELMIKIRSNSQQELELK